MKEGLQWALCALSFFRNRHTSRPRFKHARRSHNASQVVSNYVEYVRSARHFILLARKAGWRGSVVDVVTKGEKGKP